MGLFSSLYTRVISWAGNKNAPWYLGAMTIAEASFFPVPAEVMLIPMILAQRNRAFAFAGLTTACSVVGGMLGYCFGVMFIHLVTPVLQDLGYMNQYHEIQSWFIHYGIWIILVGSFSPIPYKLFTIAAGSMHMMLLPFVLMAFLGRCGRYFLVTTLVYRYGKPIEQFMKRYIDTLGWSLVLLAILGIFYRMMQVW